MNARPLTPDDWEWGEAGKYVAPPDRRKGGTSYPFTEMAVNGPRLILKHRKLSTVRSAIQRYVKAQKARDSKFRQKFIARRTADQVVTVWRVA